MGGRRTASAACAACGCIGEGAAAPWGGEQKIEESKVESMGEERVLASSQSGDSSAKVALLRNFEFKLPLVWLLATPASPSSTEQKPGPTAVAATNKLRLRFSLWQNRLPVDSLPLEGWIELQLVSEGDLLFGA